MKRTTTSGRTAKLVALAMAAAVVLAPVDPASAQEGPSEPNPLGTVIGALGVGALGFFGGMYVGALGDCYEICDGIVYGAVAGQILGVPLGAHLGNRGRGNLAADLGVSLVSVGIGLASSDSGLYLMSMIGQVVAVTVTEIETSPDVTIHAGPRLVGDEVGVGFSVTW